MKKVKVVYWVSTGLIALMMAFSAYAYMTSAQVMAGFVHLGFPSYFRVELAIAKLIGAVMLVVPAIKGRVKEWAYSGFFIVFASALVAHIASGDAASVWAMVVVFIVLLGVSYYSYVRIQDKSVAI